MAIRSVIWAAFSLLALVGCGGASTQSPPAGGVDRFLVDLTITPPDIRLQVGSTADYEAIGLYSDGTQGLVAVAWSSSDPAVVSIDSSGSATSLAVGSALIQATSVSDPTILRSTLLTIIPVVVAPVITTTALPSCRMNQPYSAGLQYTGGSGAPTWTIVTGAIPPGLSLDSLSGVISGTPTGGNGAVTSWTIVVYDPVTNRQSLVTTYYFLFEVELFTADAPDLVARGTVALQLVEV